MKVKKDFSKKHHTVPPPQFWHPRLPPEPAQTVDRVGRRARFFDSAARIVGNQNHGLPRASQRQQDPSRGLCGVCHFPASGAVRLTTAPDLHDRRRSTDGRVRRAAGNKECAKPDRRKRPPALTRARRNRNRALRRKKRNTTEIRNGRNF